MWGQILDYGWHLILPTVALSLTGFAVRQRLSCVKITSEPHGLAGLPDDRVIYVHALRNAVNPLIALLGFEAS
jgi:peptide/nickel transport system permease protein